MAIFHLSAKVISRGKGQSVVAAAAYQSRARLYDERDGQTKNYDGHGRQELLHSGIYTPAKAPAWARDRGQLWNAAERAEDEHNRTRAKSAQTARHIELALPHELDLEQNRRLVQDFVRDNFTRKGFVCDVNIHAPDRGGDGRNIHAHILVTMRRLDGEAFSREKPRLTHSEQREQLAQWRENWARQQSRHLERAGFQMEAARMVYAHRTLEEQQKVAEARGDLEHAKALQREATIHEGPTATQMKRDGRASWRVEWNERKAARRDELVQMRAELRSLEEAEPRVFYANTPQGRLSRLERVQEWQLDRLRGRQERARLRQDDAHTWQRREQRGSPPVTAAWQERERAEERDQLRRRQLGELEDLLERQERARAREQEREKARERPARPLYEPVLPPRLGVAAATELTQSFANEMLADTSEQMQRRKDWQHYKKDEVEKDDERRVRAAVARMVDAKQAAVRAVKQTAPEIGRRAPPDLEARQREVRRRHRDAAEEEARQRLADEILRQWRGNERSRDRGRER